MYFVLLGHFSMEGLVFGHTHQHQCYSWLCAQTGSGVYIGCWDQTPVSMRGKNTLLFV